MASFSKIAEKKMLELEKNYSKMVGRELYRKFPVKYKDFTRTDCITFSVDVISHTFNELGNPEAAKKVKTLRTHGTKLAKYLVENQGWAAIYISSDVYHPYDGNHEHGLRYYKAKTKCAYENIPISFFAINFKPTPKPAWTFWGMVTGETKNKKFYKGVAWNLRKNKDIETPKNLIGLNEIKKSRFGFGVSKGGLHTWLYSYGHVHEAHWDKAESELYEATPLMKWAWIDNVVVVPPEEKAKLTSSVLTTCTLP